MNQLPFPKNVIDEVLANEKPIKIDPEHVLIDDIGTTLANHLKKLAKEKKQAERDASVRENFKFCRKKCKLFHKRLCFNKSFNEQKSCFESKAYERTEGNVS